MTEAPDREPDYKKSFDHGHETLSAWFSEGVYLIRYDYSKELRLCNVAWRDGSLRIVSFRVDDATFTVTKRPLPEAHPDLREAYEAWLARKMLK